MAIKGFKDIIDNKGYVVDSKDRNIFEKGIVRSNFGLGDGDMIEFILYDANDNVLPQGDEGKTARYIFLDDKNISKYFLLTQNKETLKTNNAPEYIVDVELLIKEAGYSNGIFKSQITLLNRRVGSPDDVKNKVWIHDISPSRTEIRLLPLNDQDNPNKDLLDRYGVFVNEQDFRDDTIYYIRPFIEKIKVENVVKNILMEKGTIQQGQNYVNRIKQEFKIYDFDKFIQDIRESFLKSMDYFSQNREYLISSNKYGLPLSTKPELMLSREKIQEICITVLIDTIDHFLPRRELTNKVELTNAEQITFDEIKEILDSVTSNELYESTIPASVSEPVRGCTNPKALNYNPEATEDDGSCVFAQYTKKTYYIWSSTGMITYTDINGNKQTIIGKGGDSFTINYTGIPTFEGDIRTYPKIVITNSYKNYSVHNYSIDSTTYEEGLLNSDYIRDEKMGIFTYIDKSGNIQEVILRSGESKIVCAKEDSITADSVLRVRLYGDCLDTEISAEPILINTTVSTTSTITTEKLFNDGTTTFNNLQLKQIV